MSWDTSDSAMTILFKRHREKDAGLPVSYTERTIWNGRYFTDPDCMIIYMAAVIIIGVTFARKSKMQAQTHISSAGEVSDRG